MWVNINLYKSICNRRDQYKSIEIYRNQSKPIWSGGQAPALEFHFKAQPTATSTRPKAKAKQTKRKTDGDTDQAVQAVPVKGEAAEKEDNDQKSRRRQEEEIPKEEEAAEKEDKNESTQPSSLTILASCCFVHLGLNGQTLISISWKGMFVWIDVARCREPDKHIWVIAHAMHSQNIKWKNLI